MTANAIKRQRRYEILVSGTYLESQIEVRWTGKGRKRADQVEPLIEAAWRERLVRAKPESLFPGPLCRLDRYLVSDGRLVLELGPTDYREMIGTNVCHPEIASRLGHDYLSNALAVHAAVTTTDERVLVFQRSWEVGEYPGAYDVFGGHLDPDADLVGGVPSPYATLRRELQEEIGLSETDIIRVVCHGLVRNVRTLKPDLIFDVWTRRSWAEFQRIRLDEEHRGIYSVLNRPRDIARFIKDHAEGIAPAGVAALELHLTG